jgi:lipopolysaccharide transport system permease protein
LFSLLALLAALGFGLLLATLNVRYRDFRYVVPFMMQLGLYISPVGFSTAVVPEKWRLIYSLNPMVGVIDGFRWAVLGGAGGLYWPGCVLAAGTSLLVLVLALWYFRRTERSFADII